MEFVFYAGHNCHQAVRFEPFELDYWNLIKIRILHGGGPTEAAWVYVSKENKELYDRGEHSSVIPCVLRNGSKNFPLGAYIPLILDGTSRPTAYISSCMGGSYHHPDEQARVLREIYRRGINA